jgi:hypothetical protein
MITLCQSNDLCFILHYMHCLREDTLLTGMTLTRHKTKVIATIGPASESPEMLVRLTAS